MSRTQIALGLGCAGRCASPPACSGWDSGSQDDRPAAATAEGIASIVALPSKVVAQASDQFLTDAIPNTISAHLTQVQGLETKMPPSSVEVERVRGDLGKLADAYGVSAFVVTSLTADTDRLVLNVQLVDARSTTPPVGPRIRGTARQLPRAGARRRRRAARAPCGRRPHRSSRRPTTSNSEAELAYQRGMHHFNRYNYQHEQKDFDQGLAAFEQALTLEPRMADAAAGIAWMHQFAIEAGTPVEQALPQMRQWVQRALEMDERNSRAWAVKVPAELLATPSRQRDAVIASLRAATYGPRDAFAVNTTGIALWATASSLSLASHAGGGAAGSSLSVCAPQRLRAAGLPESPGGSPRLRGERAADRDRTCRSP